MLDEIAIVQGAEATIARLQRGARRDIVHNAREADFGRHRQDFLNKTPEGMFPLRRRLSAPPPSRSSQILRICNEEKLAVTPQGGIGPASPGGGVPAAPSLVLSLERMRAIEEVDVDGATMTVQAGVVLEAVQDAADEAGLFFPLDLGGRGSAQIGGNTSSNAGGNRVIRYGMMRELVLGIEAVHADGT